MTIGNNIKKIRKNKGLTQKDLASRLNVTTAMISQYENNANPPKIDTLEKIAKALEVSPIDLIGEFAIDETGVRTAFYTSNGIGTFIFDSLDSDEKDEELLSHFYKLNEMGQNEAIKRIAELAEIEKYKK